MTTTTLTGFALAATMIATGVAAQDEVYSRFEFISADPENGLATIQEGADYQVQLDCDSLSANQSRIILDGIEHATSFSGFGSSDRWVQDLKVRLVLGYETLSDAYAYYADVIGDDADNSFSYVAQLGKEAGVFEEAQIKAGCYELGRIAETGLPSPKND